VSLITRMLKGKCTYWPLASAESASGQDFDSYGQPQYGTPVELDCRWENKTVEFVAANGTQQLSKAVIYVSSDVVVGGVLLESELADVSDQENPFNNEGACEIKGFDKMPNIRQTEYLRTAYV
jgi:hypothetical protein